jgi:hypothetical protein
LSFNYLLIVRNRDYFFNVVSNYFFASKDEAVVGVESKEGKQFKGGCVDISLVHKPKEKQIRKVIEGNQLLKQSTFCVLSIYIVVFIFDLRISSIERINRKRFPFEELHFKSL